MLAMTMRCAVLNTGALLEEALTLCTGDRVRRNLRHRPSLWPMRRSTP